MRIQQLVLLLALLLLTLLGVGQAHARPSAEPTRAPEILVLYLYSAADPEYLHNLEFFVHTAVAGDSRSELFVIVPQNVRARERELLPQLPENGNYLFNARCNTFGAMGWALFESGQIKASRYKYFVFMDASARGPFLPVYAQDHTHWAQPFIKRLDGKVKLVGPSISCRPAQSSALASLPKRDNPYVQGYFMVTDRQGLDVLETDEEVFKCHWTPAKVRYHSIMGASAAILEAGFSLDCLMIRYQGIDWTDYANWKCNGRVDPLGLDKYDGINLDPMETIFVPVHTSSLQKGLVYARKATKYSDWAEADKGNYTWLSSNEYTGPDKARLQLPRLLVSHLLNARCLDYEDYLKKNPDLEKERENKWAMWYHHLFHGQFEQRTHARFVCDMDYDRVFEVLKDVTDAQQLLEPEVMAALDQAMIGAEGAMEDEFHEANQGLVDWGDRDDA